MRTQGARGGGKVGKNEKGRMWFPSFRMQGKYFAETFEMRK